MLDLTFDQSLCIRYRFQDSIAEVIRLWCHYMSLRGVEYVAIVEGKLHPFAIIVRSHNGVANELQRLKIIRR